MVWMLTALVVGIVMAFALLSFQRVYAIQQNGQAVLESAAHAAAVLGTCDQSGRGDRQLVDPAAAEVAFVEAFYNVTHMLPAGVQSPTQSPAGDVRSGGLGLVQPTCSLAGGAGPGVPPPAEYVLTYPAANPYLQPFTVTLAVYEPSQVGEPLPGDPGLQAQQPGVFALMEGHVMYTLAGLNLEPLDLKAAAFGRVTGTPPSPSSWQVP